MCFHRQFFESVGKRTDMYMVLPSKEKSKERYLTVCAYLRGYDAATGALLGFDEWVKLELDRLDISVVWEITILWLAFPETKWESDKTVWTPENSKRAIDHLFECIDRFYVSHRSHPLHMRELYAKYQYRLEQESYYNESSPGFIPRPPKRPRRK